MRIAEIFRLRFLLCHCTEFELRNLTQPELVLALQAVPRLCVFLWKPGRWLLGLLVLLSVGGPWFQPRRLKGCCWPEEGAVLLCYVVALQSVGSKSYPGFGPLRVPCGMDTFQGGCGSDSQAVVPVWKRKKNSHNGSSLHHAASQYFCLPNTETKCL